MNHAAALFTLATAAGPLFAGAARADAGAIAFDPLSGAFGTAWRAATVDEAATRAMRDCAAYGGDCAPTLTFRDGCGALASGSVAHAAKTGGDIAAAEAAALTACAALDRAGCAIVVSFCSDR